MALTRYDLTGQHRQVYELMFDKGATSTGALAKELGISAPSASRAKEKVIQTISNMPVPGAAQAQGKKRRGPSGTFG